MTRPTDEANPAPRTEAEPAPGSFDEPVRKAILKHCADAGPGKSVDPSAVARALGGNPNDVVPWRALIRRIRAEATLLQDAGTIVVLRKGKPVDIRTAKGVLRLGLPAAGAGGE